MTDAEGDNPPPPTLRRLRDDGATILVRCLRCGRARELEPADVAARVGWERHPSPKSAPERRAAALAPGWPLGFAAAAPPPPPGFIAVVYASR